MFEILLFSSLPEYFQNENLVILDDLPFNMCHDIDDHTMVKQNLSTPPKIQDHTVAMVNNKESDGKRMSARLTGSLCTSFNHAYQV